MAYKPAIILVVPQLGENIGAAARAMANFGLDDLRLVTPRDGWPNQKAIDTAVGSADIVHRAKIFQTIEESIADLHYIMATTARSRDMEKAVVAPRQAMKNISALPPQHKIGILFGRERIGLLNEEAAVANLFVTIPTESNSSLNVAHAVTLLCYEWFCAQADASKLPAPTQESIIPAAKESVTELLVQMESALEGTGYFKTPEIKPKMQISLRNMFHRNVFTEQEIRTLRGVVSGLIKNFRI